MNRNTTIILLCLLTSFTACKKDKDPIFIIAPSEGVEKVTFNGLAGTETGSTAANSVYLDLSGEKSTVVLRSGWDLGFYSGTDFKVILNNTTSGAVKVLSKTDLSSVTAEDTIGLTLAVSQMNPQPSDLEYFDDLDGDLKKTAIPAISAIDANNPVIILNRGVGGTAPRPWIKLRIIRNGNGYRVQYANILETNYKSIEVSKNPDYHFQFISFENGIVQVEPDKSQWDLVWTYSVFKANFGWGVVPYNFSDIIGVNYLSGVKVKEAVYADGATANAAYSSFNKDSLTNYTLVEGRWTIGSSWRSTMPAIGAKPDRFYIIKDPNDNYYKFKALSMGVGTDGGTRGKPEFKYALIK
ncbi:MAG: HmuY family protein [Ginsengibacter sp.]